MTGTPTARLLRGTALAALLAWGAPATAQTVSSTVRGRVVDLDDEGIPGVRVVAVETETGFSREALTGPDGAYRLLTLRPGHYEVAAELPGYARGVRQDVEVALQSTLVVNFVLPPALEERIEVSGEAPLLDPTDTSVGTRIGQEVIESTPLNGRSFIQLALLDSSIQPPVPAVFASGEELTYSVNGSSARANSFLVDGSSNNDFVFGTAANARFPLLAIQEYLLLRDGYGAEFGRASGGVFNVVTRSGTNDLSGTAFYQLSGDQLNESADSVDGTPSGGTNRDTMERRQFGVGFGGPFVKDRAFYFLAYEGGREDSAPFYTGVDRDGVAGGRFAGSRDGDRFFLKTDFLLDAENTLTARLSYNEETIDGVAILGRHTPEAGSTIEADGFQAALSLKSIITPNLINEARFQFSDSASLQTANSQRPGVERPGGIYGGRDLTSRDQSEVQFQFIDNVTWSVGEHFLKFGVDLSRVEVDITTQFHPNGVYVYTTDEPFEGGDTGFGSRDDPGIGIPGVDDDGDGIIDEQRVLGTYPLIYRLIEGTPDTGIHDTVLGLFVQDEWRPREDLRLNFGLRYDLESFELDERFAVDSAIDNGGADRDTDNIAPRFSFTWLPTPSQSVMIRGGVGMFYDKVVLGFPAVSAITSDQTIRLGFFQGLGFPCTEDVLETFGVEFVKAECGLLDFKTESLATKFSTGDTLDTPYTVQWNLGLERMFPSGVLFGIDYIHARGHHVPLYRDLNPIIGEDATTAGLPLHVDTTVGSIIAIETLGNTWYDALQLKLQRDRGKLRYLASYTYSRSEDEGSDPLMNEVSIPPDSVDIHGERAASDNDRRHRLALSGSWDSPWWGLKFSPRISYASGTPFNVTLGIDDSASTLGIGTREGDLLADGFAQERPPGIARNSGAGTPLHVVNSIREAWCQDTQFATPCLAPFTGDLDEPDFFQVDLMVARSFDMGGSQIEGFVQILNLFDRSNRGFVEGAISSENFGKPLALVGPPRIVELGVRFGF